MLAAASAVGRALWIVGHSKFRVVPASRLGFFSTGSACSGSIPAAWRLLLCRLPVPDHRRHGPGLGSKQVACQASPHVMTEQRATIDRSPRKPRRCMAGSDGCKLQISLGADRNESVRCGKTASVPHASRRLFGMAPRVSPNFLLRGGILSEEERSK